MKFYTVFVLQMNARLQWVKRVRKINNNNTDPVEHTEYHHHHHHHHQSVTELGHLLTRSGLMYPEVSLTVYHDFFYQFGNIVS